MNQMKTDYLNTFKFGFLKLITSIIQLFVSLAKNKIISSYYGVGGLGILSSFQSSINLINIICNLNISNSAVREIPKQLAKKNLNKANSLYKTANILLVGLGLIGTIGILLFSADLSQIVFKDTSQKIGFQIIALSILFNQIASAKGVWMRATGEHQLMFFNHLFGTIVSFIISTILLIFMPSHGIPLSIVMISMVNVLSVYLFSYKIKPESSVLNKLTNFDNAKILINTGKSLTFLDLIKTFSENLIRIIIIKHKDINFVGNYSAGFSMLQLSIGTLTSSLNVDFSRNLSFNHSNPKKVKEIVRNHINLSQLILLPILLILVINVEYFITILFSDQFSESIPLILSGSIGISIEKIHYPIGQYLYIIKGTRYYIINQLLGIFTYSILGCILFINLGLLGFGIAYIFQQAIMLVTGSLWMKKEFKFSEIYPINPWSIIQHVIFLIVVGIQFLKSPLINLNYLGFVIVLTLSAYIFWKSKNQ